LYFILLLRIAKGDLALEEHARKGITGRPICSGLNLRDHQSHPGKFMPELPEVEAVCRKLREGGLEGSEILAAKVSRVQVTRPQKPRTVETKLAGRVIEKVERRAKNILLHLSGGLSVRVHLRMTGNLYLIPDVRFRPAHTRMHFELAGGRGLIFEDSRLLGKVHLHPARELAKLLGDLGPEPLSDSFSAEWLCVEAAKSRQPAKLFLMDQTRIAGLGNIYAAEALFRARIHPEARMNTLTPRRVRQLHQQIVAVLRDALQSAVKAYSGPGEFGEAEDFPVAVYDREDLPCDRCGRRIRRIPQGGRSTYFCPGCQRV
jgi:formamidopyrimidine-DNA glycosylase